MDYPVPSYLVALVWWEVGGGACVNVLVLRASANSASAMGWVCKHQTAVVRRTLACCDSAMFNLSPKAPKQVDT